MGKRCNFLHSFLGQDNAVTEQQAIKAKLDSVCLEKEQLAYELTELHEKISTNEFVSLEKQASKEQEVRREKKKNCLKMKHLYANETFA